MKLLLDVGNTKLKWMCVDSGQLAATGEIVHRNLAPQEFLAALADLPEGAAAVYMINVAGPDIDAALTAFFVDSYDVRPKRVVSESTHGPLKNGYRDVSQLGADRWVAMIGAIAEFEGALCVVDAGTAVTIDLIRSDGQHKGGLILPGLSLMRDSLYADTGDIEQFSEFPESDALGELGYGTEAAVRLGSLAAIVGAIGRVMSLGDAKSATLVLTGGDAMSLMPLLEGYAPVHVPSLLLNGLLSIADNDSDAL